MSKPQKKTAEEHGALGAEVAVKRDSRRHFLKATGALIITAGAGAGCKNDTTEGIGFGGPITAPESPMPTTTRFPNRVEGQYPAVPDTPDEPPNPGVLYFFTLHEARTVDALTSIIFPGTPEDPGAHEAGVVNFIDFLLSHEHGFAQPIYRNPPFAEPYQGPNPPQDMQDSSEYQVIWVTAEELPRYGYQSPLTPREIYRRGLEAVDSYSRQRFGAVFIDLTAEQQEVVIEAMANGDLTTLSGPQQQDQDAQAGGGGAARGAEAGAAGGDAGYYPPSLEDFFAVLRTHTIEGMFADPLYGGNRDLVGWKFLGYPGAQRAYTVRDMLTEGTNLEPQSIADLSHFHPGQRANDAVLLPVSGSDQKQGPDK